MILPAARSSLRLIHACRIQELPAPTMAPPKANAPLSHSFTPHAHSDINNLQGVGSIVTINGRAWLVNDTTACPGARAGKVFHSDSSIPPMDRRSRLMTFESLILCNTQLLIR